jgi:O-antigen ligase
MNRTLPRASSFIYLILAALLFATVFAIKADFFQFLITAKQWKLEQTTLLVIAFLVVSLPFARRIKVSVLDAGVLVFSLWWILNEVILQTDYPSYGQTAFQVVLWLSIYLFIRTGATNNKVIAGVAIVFLLTALLQSSLGLLQLYGFKASYHALFNITGTFHNPGPFSGFVVSALPLAMVGYTIGSTESHGGGTEAHREISLRGVNINLQKVFSGIFKGVSLLTIIAVLLVVPAAQSRAAWVAALVGSIYVLWSCKERFSFINRLSVRFVRLSKTLRVLLIASSIILLLGAATGIYLLKKDSANGRLLIWQVTSQLIKERPITGHGSGAFSALYMDEQAKWFKSEKGTDEQAIVAGSPESPFNKPLKLWLEKGLIGVLLAGGILGIILFPEVFNSKPETRNSQLETRNHQKLEKRNSQLETRNKKLLHPLPTPPNPLKGEPQPHIAKTRNTEPETRNSKQETRNSQPETLKTGLKGTLISILTFSLFSYPFDISSFTLQLVVIVGLLSSTTPLLTTIKGRRSLLLTMPIVVLLIAAGVWYFPQRQAHYAALKNWQEAKQFYNMRSYNIASETYEEAFPVLKTNGLFLQMYGKALSMDEQHKKSNEILALAQKHYSSYIIQNTLGDNHKALGNYDKAETAYRKSSNMVPGLLLPKYLLAKLYNESAQTGKAKKAAIEILNSPVKVKSTATNEIMKEMKNTLTQNQETINTKLASPLPTPPNPLKGEPQTHDQNTKHKTRNPQLETRNSKLTNK